MPCEVGSLITAIGRAHARHVLGGPKDPGRSSYQVKLDVCESCRRGWQEGRGQSVEVAAAVVEMAECDGQRIGPIPSRTDAHVGRDTAQALGVLASRVDTHVGRDTSARPVDPPAGRPSPKPARATQSIAPSVRRWVLRRDRGSCVLPGCSNANFLDVHHIRPQQEGGDHDPSGLATLCGAHHKAVHEGRLVLEGDPSERLAFFHTDGTPYGAAVAPEVAELETRAFQALRHLGFKHTEARRALDAVKSEGATPTLESLVKQALSLLT